MLAQFGVDVKGCAVDMRKQSSNHDSNLMTEAYGQIAVDLGVVIKENAEVDSFILKGKKVEAIKLKNGELVKGDKFVITAGVHSKSLG